MPRKVPTVGFGGRNARAPLLWGHPYEDKIQNGAAEQNYETPDAKHPIGSTLSYEQEH